MSLSHCTIPHYIVTKHGTARCATCHYRRKWTNLWETLIEVHLFYAAFVFSNCECVSSFDVFLQNMHRYMYMQVLFLFLLFLSFSHVYTFVLQRVGLSSPMFFPHTGYLQRDIPSLILLFCVQNTTYVVWTLIVKLNACITVRGESHCAGAMLSKFHSHCIQWYFKQHHLIWQVWPSELLADIPLN